MHWGLFIVMEIVLGAIFVGGVVSTQEPDRPGFTTMIVLALAFVTFLSYGAATQ